MSTHTNDLAAPGFAAGAKSVEAMAASLFRLLVVRPLEVMARSYRRERALAELQALDNHMLRDLGIDRSEISSVVHGLTADASRRRSRRG